MDHIRLHSRFTPSFEKFSQKITLDVFPELTDQARELFTIACERLEPQSIHSEVFITDRFVDQEGTHIRIGQIEFCGKILSRLEGTHRVFPYITTCGTGLEDLDLSPYDFLAFYWLDILKTQALRQAQRELKEYMSTTYKVTRTNSLNPGSGNVDIWPIDQLSGVFSLLGGSGRTNVTLTESSLMIPNKTIAGMMFDTKTSYESCAYCSRENCPDRRAPFEHEL